MTRKFTLRGRFCFKFSYAVFTHHLPLYSTIVDLAEVNWVFGTPHFTHILLLPRHLGIYLLRWLGVPLICIILYLGGPAGTMHVCSLYKPTDLFLHHDQNMRGWALLLHEPCLMGLDSYESWNNGSYTVNAAVWFTWFDQRKFRGRNFRVTDF